MSELHCWTGMRQLMTFDMWIKHYYVDGNPDMTCMLPDGHDGNHRFTPDDEITIRIEESP